MSIMSKMVFSIRRHNMKTKNRHLTQQLAQNVLLVCCCAAVTVLSGCGLCKKKPVIQYGQPCPTPLSNIDRCEVIKRRSVLNNLKAEGQQALQVNELNADIWKQDQLNKKIASKNLMPLYIHKTEVPWEQRIVIVGFQPKFRKRYDPQHGEIIDERLTFWGALLTPRMMSQIKHIGTASGQEMIMYLPYEAFEGAEGVVLEAPVPRGEMEMWKERIGPVVVNDEVTGYKVVTLPVEFPLMLDTRGIVPGMPGNSPAYVPSPRPVPYAVVNANGVVELNSIYKLDFLIYGEAVDYSAQFNPLDIESFFNPG
jgi:hypothetical protein